MKNRLSLFLCVVLAAGLLILTGCGSGEGSAAKEPEPFTLGDYTYKLEKITKTTDGYEVSLLIEGDSAPIIISGGMTKSGVDVELRSGDETYNYNQASFSVLGEEEKVGDFGARAEFSFSVAEDADAPDKAVVTDTSSSDSEEIDLSGITIAEE